MMCPRVPRAAKRSPERDGFHALYDLLWRCDVLEERLVPISVGLVFATGWILPRGSGSWDFRGATLPLLAAAIVSGTKMNPV
jgi:hypothetical protein